MQNILYKCCQLKGHLKQTHFVGLAQCIYEIYAKILSSGHFEYLQNFFAIVGHDFEHNDLTLYPLKPRQCSAFCPKMVAKGQ